MKEKKEKKQNGYFRHMAEAIKMELREHKSSFMVYLILRILVIVMLVLQVLNQNYENVFLCILTLLLLIVPSFVQVTFKIELPTTLEIIVLFFIFAAEILGEINEFYLLFPFWDTVLHTLNGFLAAAIGFSLVDLLNRSERTVFNLSPVFTAIVAFCFSMTIGVVWEFFEFGMDQFLGYDMQKDTVLVCNHIGHAESGRKKYSGDDRSDQGSDDQWTAIGGGRISGHRADRHDGRLVCEFYRCSSFFSDWIFLCEKPWKGRCRHIYSEKKKSGERFPQNCKRTISRGV